MKIIYECFDCKTKINEKDSNISQSLIDALWPNQYCEICQNKVVFVNQYYKSNGTLVKQYMRTLPKR